MLLYPPSFGGARQVREHPVFEWSNGLVRRLACGASARAPPRAREGDVVRDVLEHEVVVVLLKVHAIRLHGPRL